MEEGVERAWRSLSIIESMQATIIISSSSLHHSCNTKRRKYMFSRKVLYYFGIMNIEDDNDIGGIRREYLPGHI